MQNVGRIRTRLNIESKISPINDPLSNVYERPRENATEALRKDKRKFYLHAFGNNVDSPDCFRINNLHNNQITVNNKCNYPCNRRHNNLYPNTDIFNIPLSGSQSIKSKHTYPYTSNTETTHFIEPKYSCVDSEELYANRMNTNANRIQREYNILSNNDNKNTKRYISEGQYFSRVAALNYFIKINDANKNLKKSNKRSDGIYEFLKENHYVN